MSDLNEEGGLSVAEPEQKQERRHASLWNVLFLNDDYTTMDFVVEMLMKHFSMNMEAASAVMLDVHKKGVGVAGTYSRDVAETKARIVMHEAQEAGHPLATAIEPNE